LRISCSKEQILYAVYAHGILLLLLTFHLGKTTN